MHFHINSFNGVENSNQAQNNQRASIISQKDHYQVSTYDTYKLTNAPRCFTLSPLITLAPQDPSNNLKIASKIKKAF